MLRKRATLPALWHCSANVPWSRKRPVSIPGGITGGAEFTPNQVDEIVKQIKTVSTHVTVEKTEVRNPLIVFALLIFLLEIFIRRLSTRKT